MTELPLLQLLVAEQIKSEGEAHSARCMRFRVRGYWRLIA